MKSHFICKSSNGLCRFYPKKINHQCYHSKTKRWQKYYYIFVEKCRADKNTKKKSIFFLYITSKQDTRKFGEEKPKKNEKENEMK